MNDILLQEIERYRLLLTSNRGRADRIEQIEQLSASLVNNLPEGPLNIVETGASHSWADGAMGLLFANLAQRSGGTMWVVDIEDEPLKRGSELLSQHGIDCVKFVRMDSVAFLNQFEQQIDLAHLDSWDLNMLDPLPSSLHGWREFEAIKDKMKDGSIVVFDDNYMEGTWVDWNMTDVSTGESKIVRVDVNFPCVGKGAHVLNWIKQGNEPDWKILNEGRPGTNVKLIFQKHKAS